MDSYGSWQHKKLLGEGGFGEVHYYQNTHTGHEIATKKLKINTKLKQDEIEILHKRWRKEYEWMKALKTSFIVGAVQIDDQEFLNYLRDQNPSPDLPIIIMEYCNGGDLRQRLNKVKHCNGLSEYEVREILRTLRHAIEYLHQECKIEHRDIKPENIVIQLKGNERLYKLTDFGYARDIPEATIAQSIVGTRHYVAPEVIDPGVYSKTVDYWSIGVMAYEIICGQRPFIPHQHIIQIMTEIKKKPKKCIAIIQTDDELVTYEDKLCTETHQSTIFKLKMEKWLQLALDNNHKTRGFDCSDNQFKFYTDLDGILNTKILTLYCLKTHKFYYYDIIKFNNVQKFYETISNDTGSATTYVVLPTNHPKKSLNNIKHPIDFFVPEWCDTNNSDNPPVMLYANDYKQCDFNVKLHERLNLSETFKKCISMDPRNCNDLPTYQLEHFEKSIHFILSNQQYLMDCHLKGLYECIIDVDNYVVDYETVVDEVFSETFMLNGRIIQFRDTVNEMIKTQTNEIAQLWLQKADEYLKRSQKLKHDVKQKIKIPFKSVLRHCNNLTLNDDIYKTLSKSDILRLKDFRKFLLENQLHKNKRMDYCQRAFDTLLKEFDNFVDHKILKEIRENLLQQLKNWHEIGYCIESTKKDIYDINIQLRQDTLALMGITANRCATDPIAMTMQSLYIDANGKSCIVAPTSSVSMNSLCNGVPVFDLQTSKVIEESNKLLTLIDTTMEENDEDNSMHVDVPTTNNI